MTTPEPPIEDLAFDEALAELQRTVAELEAGGQPLEASIALYERGVALQARCEQLLTDAELRVQQLVAARRRRARGPGRRAGGAGRGAWRLSADRVTKRQALASRSMTTRDRAATSPQQATAVDRFTLGPRATT